MAMFSAWMMEFEREMTLKRVRSGIRQTIDEVIWVGRPPYGFVTDPERPDVTEADIEVDRL